MRTGDEIINSRHFVTPEEVSIALKALIKKGVDDDTILNELCEYSYLFEISHDSIKTVIYKMLKLEREASFEERSIIVDITKPEVEFIKSTTTDDGMKKFLLLLLVASKRSNHPFGWDEYKRSSYLKILNINKKSPRGQKLYEQWIRDACDAKLVELRVVGSKNPISCFKLSYRHDEGEIIGSLSSFEDLNKFYEAYVK